MNALIAFWTSHREETLAPGSTTTHPRLQRHLHRHFDGHGARVGEKDVVEPRRRDLDEKLGQLDRRRMGEAAEHHVRHPPELQADGIVENRMAIAMDGRPPR